MSVLLKRLETRFGRHFDGLRLAWRCADEIARERGQSKFGMLAEAVSFVVRLGFVAESADHHPDFLINYKRVTLTYRTHSAGGLTEKDFTGAGEAMKIAARFGAS